MEFKVRPMRWAGNSLGNSNAVRRCVLAFVSQKSTRYSVGDLGLQRTKKLPVMGHGSAAL